MNKRQAKKQFKKKYGVNPNEFVCNMDVIAEGVWKACDDICKAMPAILEEISKSLNDYIAGFNKFVQSDEFKKVVRAIGELEKEKKEGDGT